MEKEENRQRKLWMGIFILIFIFTGIFPRLPIFETIKMNVLDSLSKKELLVASLTALSSSASLIIAAAPGDATTPIATQISQLSSFLLIVVCAIFLEKIIFSASCSYVITWIVPGACLIGFIFELLRIKGISKFLLKICLAGILFWGTVPVSEMICDNLKTTILIDQYIGEAETSLDIIEEETVEYEENTNKFKNFLSTIANTLTESINNIFEKAKSTLQYIIDSIALLLVTTIAMPIVILYLFMWLLNSFLGINIEIPSINKVYQAVDNKTNIYKKLSKHNTDKQIESKSE